MGIGAVETPHNALVACLRVFVIKVALHAVTLPVDVGDGVVVGFLVTEQTRLIIAEVAPPRALHALILVLSVAYLARAPLS